ncbi:MAG TPA: OstA-like protein [Cyclobacteriaceae bacterium]|jgi:lipopolysaccharide export system protein LptA
MNSIAQDRIRIENSREFIGGKLNGEDYQKLIGEVIFKREDTWIYCDEAIYFKKRSYIEAKGNVHIIDGDSVDITSEILIYDGNTRVAKLRNNVIFTKLGIMTLYTDNLDYDRVSQVANYFSGGKLVDSTNTLTSRRGYYDVNTNMASFKHNVVGKNKNYTLTSDTLQYNSATKIIYFRDRSILIDDEGNVLEYDEGIYNTLDETSLLERNIVRTESYIIKANIFNLDDKKQEYRAKRNVELVDTENDIIVTGQSAIYSKRTGITKVFDQPVLKVLMDGDTLFLSADTLVAYDSDIEAKKKLIAYHNVKFFKEDLQGRADSLIYEVSDSLIHFFTNPILWTEGNQIIADTISAFIVNKKIDKMKLVSNSFIVSQDTLSNFNQVKGRNVLAFFKDNKISLVQVTGNGESLFYALNDEETDLIGLNKSTSSNITINFENNKAKEVHFYTSVEASFIPPHELKPADRNLKGFTWRIKEKPTLMEVLGELKLLQKLVN